LGACPAGRPGTAPLQRVAAAGRSVRRGVPPLAPALRAAASGRWRGPPDAPAADPGPSRAAVRPAANRQAGVERKGA